LAAPKILAREPTTPCSRHCSIGAGSAALLAGEQSGAREITGVVLISAAGLLDALWHAKDQPAPRG